MKNKPLILSLIILFLIGFAFPAGEIINKEISSDAFEDIGNLIGNELDISAKGVRVTKDEEISTIDFFGDDASARIKDDVYENIDTNKLAYLKLNNLGEVISADLTAKNDTVFVLGGKENRVLAGQRITYKNGKVTVYGKGDGDSFEYKEKGFDEFTKVDFLGESIEIEKDLEGNSIFTGDFTIGGNEIRGLGEGNGKATVSKNGEILEVWGGTIATLKGVECSVFQENVKISYDENFDLLNCKGNCLNLGEGSIDLSGKDFSVSLQEGNEIFPEFGKVYDYPSSSRLDFAPNGGSLKIERISEKGQPFALLVDMEGEADIINGQWHLKADGEDIYARITEGVICSLPFRSLEGVIQSEEIQDCIFETPLPSDMRIKYSDSETDHKIYDLDVKSEYYKKLPEQEIRRIEEEISNLNILKEQTERERNSILEDSFVKELLAERQKLSDVGLYRLNAEGIFVINEETQRRLDEINSNPNILKINKFNNYLREVEYDLDIFDSQLRGIHTFGGFGEVILANDGDVQLSYPEFIQGYRVIQNAKIYDYSGQEFGILDKLDLDVSSKLQTCADTPYKLRALWELNRLKNGEQDSIKFTLANEEEIQYNLDGTYSFWDGNEVMTKKNKNLDKGFNEWLHNLFAYSNTGSLTRDLMPIENINDLQPGDLITLHPDPITGYGHTIGIKEILEIPPGSGEIHYRMFAGSDPAIDARIYPNLWDEKDFIDQIKSGELHLLRWKKT